MTKYGAKKTDGYSSKKEAKRAQELKLLEKAGEISHLKEQPRYELIPPARKSDGSLERGVVYIADFAYEKDGALVVEDVKGIKTPEYIIKRKLMLFRHGIEVREV